MTKPLPFTEASIRRAVSAARKAGLRVVAIQPDGTVVVEDGDDGATPLPPAEDVGQIPPSSSKWEDAEA